MPDATQGSRVKPPALPPALTATAWVLIPAWLYIHAFLWAANSGREVASHLAGPPWWLFMAACVLGLHGGPLWVVAALAAFVVAVRRGAWPGGWEWAQFAVLATLISAYLRLLSLD